MSVIGVIPARWGSTRLPGKSLIAICGTPLIQWVVEGARKADRLDRLIVATDDERIAEAVRGLGCEAAMTRSDHPSGTDRVAEVAAQTGAETVINIQGDEPLIDPGLIDALADALAGDADWDMATAAVPIGDTDDLNNPSVVKVVWGQDGRALYFSRSPIPHVRGLAQARWLEAASFWGHVGIYGYRREVLTNYGALPESSLEQAERLEQLRFLQAGYQIQTVETASRPIAVDTPQDLEHVREIMGGGQE